MSDYCDDIATITDKHIRGLSYVKLWEFIKCVSCNGEGGTWIPAKSKGITIDPYDDYIECEVCEGSKCDNELLAVAIVSKLYDKFVGWALERPEYYVAPQKAMLGSRVGIGEVSPCELSEILEKLTGDNPELELIKLFEGILPNE